MSTAVAPAVSQQSSAALAADRNTWANLAALARRQPAVGDRLRDVAFDGEWVFGRDGMLTAIDAAGRFLDGCSVPLRLAQVQLRSFDPQGTTLCFLSPPHAADVRTVFDRLNDTHALIVVQPDEQRLGQIIACADFSSEIDAGRLFFSGGENWADDFRQMFTDHPGLPTPQQFVKLPSLEQETLEAMVTAASTAFAEALNDRANQIARLHDRPRSTRRCIKRVGLLVRSRFALWDDAGYALASALMPGFPAVDVRALDIDQPLSAGPLATAQFTADCDAIVCADIGRADFPSVVSPAIPWATWITTGRIPDVNGAAAGDQLLVADASLCSVAQAAGWAADRVHVAGWPGGGLPIDAGAPQGWTVIADTRTLEPPEPLERFSSHRLLWEAIAAELTNDPFRLGDDATRYLDERAARSKIDLAQLDRPLFLSALIGPAFAQGLVRLLTRDRQPVQAFGTGWATTRIDGVTARGSITNRHDWEAALRSSRQLLHVWPAHGAHPIDWTGRPVLRPASTAAAYLRAARSATKTASATPKPIDLAAVLNALAY